MYESALKSKNGRYDIFGGCYVPESLMAPLLELKIAFKQAIADTNFTDQLKYILATYAGRPTPLTAAKRFSDTIGGPQLFLKREDLLHTGAHKLNNALGQCLLAKHLGKKRVIAETGAGQHGVATATACAYFDLQCDVYMGAVDMKRQAPNVARMKLLGATIIAVDQGSQTLKDAVNAALRDYAESYSDTHYCLGSALGPDPYPEMVATFQSVIGEETKKQILQQTGHLPDAVIACVGGGSNAIGIFSAFTNDTDVALIGVEGGGRSDQLGDHAARFKAKQKGVLHGAYTYVLQNKEGQIAKTHSIAAGLDYPAVGPAHAALFKSGRAVYTSVKDDDVIKGFLLLAKTEGIIPALESAHTLAYLMTEGKNRFRRDDIVIVNLSGRGDKDLPQILSENKNPWAYAQGIFIPVLDHGREVNSRP